MSIPVRELIADALPDGAQVLALADGVITGIAQDSRDVVAGGAFVAVRGGRTDGHNYLADAHARGARLLVVQEERRDIAERLADGETTVVLVPDTRAALASLSAAFYRHPSRRLRVVGVTGTDGKTSTVFLAAAVLEAGGRPTDFLSTAAFKEGDAVEPNDTHMTSPDAIEVQRRMAAAVERGAECYVLESSSHGLDQRRLDTVHFDVAVLTNLADDHLDYHHTHEAYVAAKARLLDLLTEAEPGPHGQTAVLNTAAPYAGLLGARAPEARPAPCLWYGIDPDADVRPSGLVLEGWESRWRLCTPAGEAAVRLPLPGRFNVENALAAAGVGVALEVPPVAIARGLAAFPGVPGRMQRVDAGQPFAVVVDYAHAPQALSEALVFARGATEGRVIVVFGAAGDRDPARRTGMAAVVTAHADFAVVTSDDTWTEEPAAIIGEIRAALEAHGRQADSHFVCIEDRRAAIARACAVAQAGDTVLLAGIGAQRSIVVRGEPVPWDEVAVAREALGG